jgi:hypothetical protein
MGQADTQRLDRLVGDGNGEAGIDLASLFRVILNQVQDSADGIDMAGLTAPVQGAVSNHARVEHWYREKLPGADPWKALIADALEQLESRRLLTQDGGRWHTGPDFTTGKRMRVVPGRTGRHKSVGVILYAADDREARGVAEKRRMEITSLAASLREDGRGLRPLDKDHVAALEQSMRDYGYRPEFPVLVDRQGRILDGRHRIAAARRAGVDVPPPRPVAVDSDEEAVGFALLVNFQRGWTTAERNRINADLKAAGLTMENFGRQLGTVAKRELIAAALRDHPDWSHNQIAKQLDVHNTAVDRVCRSEVTQCVTSECTHGRNGQGARNDLIDSGSRPRSSALEDKIEPIIREHPERSNNQVLAEAGLTRNHHAVAARVRDRLEEEGVISPAPVREGSDGRPRHVVTQAKPGPAISSPQAAEPADDDSGLLDQMVTLFLRLTARRKRTLVARLLREMPDEDRAELLSEIGR